MIGMRLTAQPRALTRERSAQTVALSLLAQVGVVQSKVCLLVRIQYLCADQRFEMGTSDMKKAGAVILTGLLFSALGQTANAQALTAFKTGEESTGMTKQCFYDGLGSQYVRTVSSISLCPLSIQVPGPASPSMTTPNQEPIGSAMAFKTGENTTGMTKQCFYDYLGSAVTRTVSSIALCPLSIRVR